ncbi:MAG: hypothetical protein U5R31_00925 [Acidimicrobiia bacterium]|nr:hypothetical protein [Acidimicrobiia bacterium]
MRGSDSRTGSRENRDPAETVVRFWSSSPSSSRCCSPCCWES